MVTWPTCSPSTRTGGGLRAEMAVGVDLHLHAAIAEDALGHDGDGVDAVVLGRDDEGRGLVVGIGGAGADAGDEGARRIEQLAVPLAAGEGHQLAALVDRALHQHDRIDADQRPSSLA